MHGTLWQSKTCQSLLSRAPARQVLMLPWFCRKMALPNGQSVTVTNCTRVDCAIPHKYGRAKAMKKFFERVMQAFLKEIDFKVVLFVVVANPGFTKDRFREYLFLESERQMVRDVIDNKSKITLAHASSGYEHSLREILQSPIVMKKIRDTRSGHTMLSHDASRC